MELKINIGKLHLIVMALAISLVMGSILFSSYAAILPVLLGMRLVRLVSVSMVVI